MEIILDLPEHLALKVNMRAGGQNVRAKIFGGALKGIPTECLASRDKRERGWSVCRARIERQQMLFTVEEVAIDHLKVSRSTIYRLIRNGELKSSKVLGCTRISSHELERFERMIGGH